MIGLDAFRGRIAFCVVVIYLLLICVAVRCVSLSPRSRLSWFAPGHQLTMGRKFRYLQKRKDLSQCNRYY